MPGTNRQPLHRQLFFVAREESRPVTTGLCPWPVHSAAYVRIDSCVLNKETGDSLLVYFTEASGGTNMIAVLARWS